MKYNILAIPDIHWGVIDPTEQMKYLDFILSFIEKSYTEGIHIDLIVILGDYFDSKLPLNSREAIYAINWMNELYNIALRCNVNKIRMVHGTMDHDNDQLDVFKSLEDKSDTIHDDKSYFFKIINKTYVEETLPDLKCIYCPDELMQTSDYEDLFINKILEIKDIGFFHGSFDVVYGELLKCKPELMEKKNVIFRYNLFNNSITGPLIAGHWHDGKIYDDLIYCGSPFRYKFNEDEIKGLSFIQYNTDDKSYFYQRITNPICPEYITYEIYSNIFKSNEDYTNIIKDLNVIMEKIKQKRYTNDKVRILVYLIDNKPENDIFISSLRQLFISNKQVKIVIKNKFKDKIKKEQIKKNKDRDEKFKFINDVTMDTCQIIHDFIVKTDDIEIPYNFIKDKYTKVFNE